MTIGHKQLNVNRCKQSRFCPTWILNSLFRCGITHKAINNDDINASIFVVEINKNSHMITIFSITWKLCLYHLRNGFKWNRTKKNIWMKNFSITIKVRISIWNVTALEGRIIFFVCVYEVCETYFAFVEEISYAQHASYIMECSTVHLTIPQVLEILFHWLN